MWQINVRRTDMCVCMLCSPGQRSLKLQLELCLLEKLPGSVITDQMEPELELDDKQQQQRMFVCLGFMLS